MPGEVEVVSDSNGDWLGYRFPKGVLGLEEELTVSKGPETRRQDVFAARADGGRVESPSTDYDHFLDLLGREREQRDNSPRIMRASDRPFEHTRQGQVRFYIDRWADLHGQDLEVAEYEIAARHGTGKHRHIAEELLLVTTGVGHDVHDESEHPWKAGDLICIPPMVEHQHFNDGAESARLVSVWSHHPANEFLGGIQHIEDSSMWDGS